MFKHIAGTQAAADRVTPDSCHSAEDRVPQAHQAGVCSEGTRGLSTEVAFPARSKSPVFLQVTLMLSVRSVLGPRGRALL